jgi:hypothetical protein
MRLAFGIVLGLALAAGGGWLYLQKGKDCLGRCGDGTRCWSGRCIVAAPPTTVAPPTDKTKRRKRRTGGELAQAELKLSPGDDRMGAVGDSLGRPEHIDLSKPGDDGRELSEEDLDGIFRSAQSGVSHCITDAVGDYPLETGKVIVRFRVERSGEVKRTRLEAPQLLLRRGLYACVRPIVTGLRFPASGGANVVEYPFALQ